MKKRLIGLCCILLILMCVFLSACGNTPDLYQKGIEITTLLQKIVYSDDYRLTFDGGEITTAYFQAKDYDSPTRVYKLSYPNPFDALNSGYLNKEPFDNLDDELKEQVLNHFDFTSVLHAINVYSMGDYFTQLFSAKKTYEGTLSEPVIYLYTFETGKPITVVFEPSGTKQFTAAGYFVLSDKFTSLSAVREVFEPYGCAVEEVTP